MTKLEALALVLDEPLLTKESLLHTLAQTDFDENCKVAIIELPHRAQLYLDIENEIIAQNNMLGGEMANDMLVAGDARPGMSMLVDVCREAGSVWHNHKKLRYAIFRVACVVIALLQKLTQVTVQEAFRAATFKVLNKDVNNSN